MSQGFFMELISWGYLGLFGGSFLSATLVPFPSEGLLYAFFKLGYPVWICVIIASFGNTIGGFTNYWIGYSANAAFIQRRFKLDETRLLKWQAKFAKYGHFMGLLAWLPLIGDPMLIALGVLKVKFWPLSIMIFIGKFMRYVFLALIFELFV